MHDKESMDIFTDIKDASDIVGLIADSIVGTPISSHVENIKIIVGVFNGLETISKGTHVSLTDLFATRRANEIKLNGESDISIVDYTSAHHVLAS